MSQLYLLKMGELVLKGRNRSFFERLLKENIERAFGPHRIGLSIRHGRGYLEIESKEEPLTPSILSKTFGLTGFARAYTTEKNAEALVDLAIEIARDSLEKKRGTNFKVETRRTDKSLPMDSYSFSCLLGGKLTEKFPALQVQLTKPDWTLFVELREKAYLYVTQEKGAGGLPVGSSGGGMLLLSGGIDSPVAGYLMAKRGLRITAIHFHTPPYTSPEAQEKVQSLAKILSPWTGGITLICCPFTELQLLLKKSVPSSRLTLHSRATMMKIASIFAKKQNCQAIITGEALGQVASQTIKSLDYTSHSATFPVLRPLIAMDKEEVIDIAKKLGTFEISCQPFSDCCHLFASPNPDLKPDRDATIDEYQKIPHLDYLIKKATEEASVEHL